MLPDKEKFVNLLKEDLYEPQYENIIEVLKTQTWVIEWDHGRNVCSVI